MTKTRRKFPPEFKRETVSPAGKQRSTFDADCGRGRDFAVDAAKLTCGVPWWCATVSGDDVEPVAEGIAG